MNPRRKLSKPKTTTMRIPDDERKQLHKIGNGDPRRGLSIALHVYADVKKDPAKIIMNDVDELMSSIKQYYPENHFNHFSNFPAFMTVFLKTGRPPSSDMLIGRALENKETERDE